MFSNLFDSINHLRTFDKSRTTKILDIIKTVWIHYMHYVNYFRRGLECFWTAITLTSKNLTKTSNLLHCKISIVSLHRRAKHRELFKFSSSCTSISYNICFDSCPNWLYCRAVAYLAFCSRRIRRQFLLHDASKPWLMSRRYCVFVSTLRSITRCVDDAVCVRRDNWTLLQYFRVLFSSIGRFFPANNSGGGPQSWLLATVTNPIVFYVF